MDGWRIDFFQKEMHAAPIQLEKDQTSGAMEFRVVSNGDPAVNTELLEFHIYFKLLPTWQCGDHFLLQTESIVMSCRKNRNSDSLTSFDALFPLASQQGSSKKIFLNSRIQYVIYLLYVWKVQHISFIVVSYYKKSKRLTWEDKRSKLYFKLQETIFVETV